MSLVNVAPMVHRLDAHDAWRYDPAAAQRLADAWGSAA